MLFLCYFGNFSDNPRILRLGALGSQKIWQSLRSKYKRQERYSKEIKSRENIIYLDMVGGPGT